VTPNIVQRSKGPKAAGFRSIKSLARGAHCPRIRRRFPATSSSSRRRRRRRRGPTSSPQKPRATAAEPAPKTRSTRASSPSPTKTQQAANSLWRQQPRATS